MVDGTGESARGREGGRWEREKSEKAKHRLEVLDRFMIHDRRTEKVKQCENFSSS